MKQTKSGTYTHMSKLMAHLDHSSVVQYREILQQGQVSVQGQQTSLQRILRLLVQDGLGCREGEHCNRRGPQTCHSKPQIETAFLTRHIWGEHDNARRIRCCSNHHGNPPGLADFGHDGTCVELYIHSRSQYMCA